MFVSLLWNNHVMSIYAIDLSKAVFLVNAIPLVFFTRQKTAGLKCESASLFYGRLC